jgi:DNA transformation protein and related proteins
MPVSDSYRTYVLEQLQAGGPIKARPMFGGVGLYREGVFFGLIDDDSLYFKVGELNRADFEHAGARQFQPYGEGSYSMSYYEVPGDVLEDRSLLNDWVTKAIAVARNATAKKRQPRSAD